jgi:hypothetical protein
MYLNLFTHAGFGGRIFQQIVGMLIGTHCAPLSPAYSLMRTKQTSNRSSHEKGKEATMILYFHVPLFI